MTSHELANLLLTLPNLPVGTFANNHTYVAADRKTHGPLKVGLLKHYVGQHILIGNFFRLDINAPNWFVTEVLFKES